jgi:hypothetical protein
MWPTGRVEFALPMRAGYKYVIEAIVKEMEGAEGSGFVQAVEKDAAGIVVEVFGPAQSMEDLASCRKRGRERAGE